MDHGSNGRRGSPSSSSLYLVPLGPGGCVETLYIDDLLAGKVDCIDNTITVLSYHIRQVTKAAAVRCVCYTLRGGSISQLWHYWNMRIPFFFFNFIILYSAVLGHDRAYSINDQGHRSVD